MRTRFIVCTLRLSENLPLLALLEYISLVISKLSSCPTKSCVPSHSVSKHASYLYWEPTYKEKASHHVHTRTDAGEEGDLVGGNHPFAAGLRDSVVSIFPVVMHHPCAACRDKRLVVGSRYAHVIRQNASQLFDIATTHLFPGPQTIVLLELALIMRDTVFAEDPTANRQYRALCGSPEVGSGGCRASWIAFRGTP
jgi:hypothetical protein